MLKFLFGKELTQKIADKIPEVCGRVLAEKSIDTSQNNLSAAAIQAKGAKEAAEITSNATRESAKAAIKSAYIRGGSGLLATGLLATIGYLYFEPMKEESKLLKREAKAKNQRIEQYEEKDMIRAETAKGFEKYLSDQLNPKS
jgi:hypothetical protein